MHGLGTRDRIQFSRPRSRLCPLRTAGTGRGRNDRANPQKVLTDKLTIQNSELSFRPVCGPMSADRLPFTDTWGGGLGWPERLAAFKCFQRGRARRGRAIHGEPGSQRHHMGILAGVCWRPRKAEKTSLTCAGKRRMFPVSTSRGASAPVPLSDQPGRPKNTTMLHFGQPRPRSELDL